jgi:hypothetical protein
MPKVAEKTKKLVDFVAQKFEAGELDNDSLVQLIELAGGYLNLMTIPDYAKAWKISYNGAKKHRNVKELFGVKFIIDNE